MSIHLHTIQKAVLVPASVLALSLTLAAAPALAQPAATVFAFPQDGVDNCVKGSSAATGPAAMASGAVGLAAGPAGPEVAAPAGLLAGGAVLTLGCVVNTIRKGGPPTASDVNACNKGASAGASAGVPGGPIGGAAAGCATGVFVNRLGK